jgi:hypothetical protein
MYTPCSGDTMEGQVTKITGFINISPVACNYPLTVPGTTPLKEQGF